MLDRHSIPFEKNLYKNIKNTQKKNLYSMVNSPFTFLGDKLSASSIVSGSGILIVSGKENTRTLAINARLPKNIAGRLS